MTRTKPEKYDRLDHQSYACEEMWNGNESYSGEDNEILLDQLLERLMERPTEDEPTPKQSAIASGRETRQVFPLKRYARTIE